MTLEIRPEMAKEDLERAKLYLECQKLQQDARDGWSRVLPAITTTVAVVGLVFSVVVSTSQLRSQREESAHKREVDTDAQLRGASEMATTSGSSADRRIAGIFLLPPFLRDPIRAKAAANTLAAILAMGKVDGEPRIECAAASGIAEGFETRDGKSAGDAGLSAMSLARLLYGRAGAERGAVTELNASLVRDSLVKTKGAPRRPDSPFGVANCKSSLGASIRAMSMSGGHLMAANFSHNMLDFGDFFQADLQGASLRFASIRGANLEGANLADSDLTDLTGFSEHEPPPRFWCTNIRHMKASDTVITYANNHGAIDISSETWRRWRAAGAPIKRPAFGATRCEPVLS